MTTTQKPKAPRKKTPKPPAKISVRDKLTAVGIDAICAYVASGESLHSWCKANGYPYQSVLDWIDGDETRVGNYTRAKEMRADAVFEALDDVSEQAVSAETAVQVQGLRLKSDNIKWKLARMNSKKYGDKLDIGGEMTIKTMTDEQLLAKAGRLADKLVLSGVVLPITDKSSLSVDDDAA